MKISDLDHTYLLTDDNIFFCVGGNWHSRDEIFGMPYYFPTKDLEKILNAKIIKKIIINGRFYTKIFDVISYDNYVTFIKKHYSQYLFSPSIWKVLMKVKRKKVKKIFDPREFSNKLLMFSLRKDSKGNKVFDILREIYKFSPTLAKNIGITGSVLLRQDPEGYGRDLDLIVYGRKNIKLAEEFSNYVCANNPDFYSLTGQKLDNYALNRSTKYKGSMDDFISISQGRWDTIFYNDFKLDFTFADDLGETIRPDYESVAIKPKVIVAKITNVRNSFFLPTLLTIDNKEFSTVVATARGYICIFKKGENVKVVGVGHIGKNREKLLVVDDFVGSYITKLPKAM